MATDGQAPKPLAHFLHLGKTGGTALKVALRAAESPLFTIEVHRHAVRLTDLPDADRFFFSTRDPVTRFVSGFLSRQRQGAPAHNSPWRPEEEISFGRFDSPESLALALRAKDQTRRLHAEAAMSAIEHVNQGYWYWFGDESQLEAAADRVLWIGRQERLDEDLPFLARALGLDELSLPADPSLAHVAPPGTNKELTEEAAENVRRWYARDYQFLSVCDELRASLTLAS
jgi:hypothetical protein